MALIRKEQGQAGVGPYWWENDGDVVEILDPQLIEEILLHPGFSDVSPTGHETSTPVELSTPETDETSTGDLGSEEEPAEDDAEASADPALDGEMPEVGASIQRILAWVGDDSQRAGQALIAESGRGVAASRTTLVAALKEITERGE